MSSAPSPRLLVTRFLRNVTILPERFIVQLLRILRRTVLLLPILPLLPITISGLRYHNGFLPWIQVITSYQPDCPGAPRWGEIWNDEVLNLGMSSSQYQDFFQSERIGLDNARHNKKVAQALFAKMLSTHPDKTHDPNSNACAVAAKDAAVALCYRVEDAWDSIDCRHGIRDRGGRFSEHFKHSLCIVDYEAKESEKVVSADINAACNAREWKMLERHGRANWEADIKMVLDPEFLWKRAIYDFFQLRQHRAVVPGSCFYHGEFYTYVKLVDTAIPAPGPTALQWKLIYGTVVYIGFVMWMTSRSVTTGRAENARSVSKMERRPSCAGVTTMGDTDLKQPDMEPTITTRRNRRTNFFPQDDSYALFAR